MNKLYVLRNKKGEYFCKNIDSSVWIKGWTQNCLFTYIAAKELDNFLGIDTYIEKYDPELNNTNNE